MRGTENSVRSFTRQAGPTMIHEAWPCRCINMQTDKSSCPTYIAIDPSRSFTVMGAGTSILITFCSTKSCLGPRNTRLRGLWRELIKVFPRG